jgi:hypothetical protein
MIGTEKALQDWALESYYLKIYKKILELLFSLLTQGQTKPECLAMVDIFGLALHLRVHEAHIRCPIFLAFFHSHSN